MRDIGLSDAAKASENPQWRQGAMSSIAERPATGLTGVLTDAGRADLVLLAREFLLYPYFGLHAAQALGGPVPAPVQYWPGFPK